MPTYTYACEKGHEFEVQQNIKDEPFKNCIHGICKASVKRLISKTSFKFKGGPPTPKFHS